MSQSSLNIELLQRVKQKILEEPAQFQMAKIFAQYCDGHSDLPRDIPNCGTAACIGGWAIAIAKKLSPLRASNLAFGWIEACEVLGVSIELGRDWPRELMELGAWPEDLRGDWFQADTLEARARVAAARIDRFVASYQDAEEEASAGDDEDDEDFDTEDEKGEEE